MAKRKLRFGVNYVPSKRWWYSWLDWDRDAVARDLEAIAALNMDHLRIHCLWPVFQPNPTYVSPVALERLVALHDLADAQGLDVVTAVLDGWLSGFAFRPAWLKQGRNMFTDPEMIEAEKHLFRSIAGVLDGHPRFLGFDLGNELGVLQQLWEPVTQDEADAWQAEMLATCEAVAPGKFHVNGVDHVHWYRDVGFSRAALATTGSATSLHTWILFTGTLERYGPNGVGTLHLPEYCVELAKAYHRDLDRPLWIQEFGASPEWMDAAQIPDFAETTIRQAATCENLWGFTWWCSHDVRPAFAGFHALEYDLGLLDVENRPKPAGLRIAELIAAWRATPPAPVARTVALVWPEGVFDDPDDLWRAIDVYMGMIEEGLRPAIVLACRAEDDDYLHQRGIETLRRL